MKKNDRLHETDGRSEKWEMGMFKHSQKDLDSCWFLLPSDQLISRAEDHLSKGADYWNSIRQNQDPFANA